MSVVNDNIINFNQNFILELGNRRRYPELHNIDDKYKGLCEIICNYLLRNDLLGKNKIDDKNFFYDRITMENLNQPEIKKSHLFNTFTTFQEAMAFLFGIYPENIFSFKEQWGLVNTHLNNFKISKSVNKDLLQRGLAQIEDGKILKLEIFKRSLKGLEGHSLLIKKISAVSYSFFDPNKGEYLDVDYQKLCDLIDYQIKRWDASDILLIDGEKYLSLVERKLGA